MLILGEREKGKMQEFKDRLRKVCQDNPDIPLFNKGQQTFIAQKVGVSQEAVRKWFHGESKPKEASSKKQQSGMKHRDTSL